MQRLRIPCRRCTDKNNGEEKLLPLQAFTTKPAQKTQEIWVEVMQLGQDAVCISCKHFIRQARNDSIKDADNIFCEKCCCPRPREFFATEAQQLWEGLGDSGGAIWCMPCHGMKLPTGVKDVELIRCNGASCGRDLPVYHFVERLLLNWRDKGTVAQEAICARCYVKTWTGNARRLDYACTVCKVTKHISEFTCVAIRHWLQQDRHMNVAVCYNCHFPPCAMPGCGQRPAHAVVWNSWVSKTDFARASLKSTETVDAIYGDTQKQWFCASCKYPPCDQQTDSACVRVREPDRKHRFRTWACKKCATLPEVCADCKRPCTADTAFKANIANVRASIATLGRLPHHREPGHEIANNFIRNACRRGLCELRKKTFESLPHWKTETQEDITASRLEEFLAHVHMHNRLPPKGHPLRTWLKHIKRLVRWKCLSQVQQRTLTDCLSKYKAS